MAILAELPFYLNGTLEEPERTGVERHLSACPSCRAALEAERALASTLTDETVASGSVEAGLAAVMARIDAGERRRQNVSSAPRRLGQWLRSSLSVRGAWMTGAVAAASVALAVVLVSDPMPSYRTLTDSEVGGGAELVVKVVLAEGHGEATLRELAGEEGLAIVGGPSESAVYTLAPADQVPDPAALEARLTNHPAIGFASLEPSTAEAAEALSRAAE